MNPSIDCDAVATGSHRCTRLASERVSRFRLSRLIGFIVPAAMGMLLNAATFAAESGLSVQVTEAWIRWLPANVPSGGYMLLTNTGTTSRVLMGAISPDFGDISIHQTRTSNGMSEMVAVDSLEVKPQSSLRFAPGGYHLMLMQSKRALHAGDRVTITLRFADGHSLEVPFEVRAASAGPPGDSNDMGSMPGMQH